MTNQMWHVVLARPPKRLKPKSVTLHRAQARSYEAGYRNRIRRDTGNAITRLIPIGM
ncbi:hypothetical protein KIP44_16485 [Xanthomonas campestris pv. campestris]|uniref:hypothetical protein n=1 Tax=Xanthomonas campestris TaxID=339 RepID=UPI001F33309E|nr:hypothetical protein [Xanthomonas campestris]MCF8839813.1 hypothetical protein [Xanthomonas campestris pv. campestris]